MFSFIKNLLGIGPKTDYAALLRQGAMIIDVRTPEEYRNGHLPRSVNIPLDTLKRRLGDLEKDRRIIACCASGMRSGLAKRILRSHGFREVYNGGSWTNLKSLIH
ncbi:MAG TPA: rhodanese-like domain-containing protein [Flavitalea sp.]|nr:rhodanese-like domain-containing protein [Flavitalea sp.]